MKTGERTRERIMETGCAIWQINPNGVSCRAIARSLEINHATILYHYESFETLKDALAEYAVSTGRAVIIAQLIATGHPAVARMTADDRQRYMLDALADVGRHELAPEHTSRE